MTRTSNLKIIKKKFYIPRNTVPFKFELKLNQLKELQKLC